MSVAQPPKNLRNVFAGYYLALWNYLSSFATSAGSFFANGGNSFAGAASLGTLNGNKLSILTNAIVRMMINAAGAVAIGPAAADASAALDVQSTTGGLLPPRMTSTQRLAISTSTPSCLVWDTTLSAYFYFNGTAWVPLLAQVGTGSIVNGVLAVANVYLSASSVIAVDVGTPTPGSGNLTIRYGVLQASRTNGSGTGSFTISALNAAGTLQNLDESTNVRWSIVGT